MWIDSGESIENLLFALAAGESLFVASLGAVGILDSEVRFVCDSRNIRRLRNPLPIPG